MGGPQLENISNLKWSNFGGAYNGGGNILYLYIGKYYQGVLTMINNVWVPYLNSRSNLRSNDITVLQDIIENGTINEG